jgi:hypothetical protein
MSSIRKESKESVEAFLRMVAVGYGHPVRDCCAEEINALSAESFDPSDVLCSGRRRRDAKLREELRGRLIPSQEATFCSRGVKLA